MASSLFLSGCPQQKSIAILTATLGNTVATIASLSGNPTLASKLQSDTALAVSLIKQWQHGSDASYALRAVNQIIDDIKLIPISDRYRPFITLALGTAASLIELLNQHTPTHDTPHTNIHLTQPPKDASEYCVDWNSIRSSSHMNDTQQVSVCPPKK